MKKVQLCVLFISGILFLFGVYACKSSSTDPDPPADTRNFYPVSNGTWYKYNMTQTDSIGNINNAVRISYITGTLVIGGRPYQVQLDSVLFTAITQVSNSYFRKTNAGVYFNLDTTGISNSVPDSLLPFLTIDEEIIAFSFPFENGRSWIAFKMNLNYMNIFNFNPVNMRITVVGTEDINLQLPGGSETKSAFRLRMELNIISSPFQTVPQVLTAGVWLVENIGVVKWEGNATIINAFTGAGIDFDDSTSVITQSLIDYHIQQ